MPNLRKLLVATSVAVLAACGGAGDEAKKFTSVSPAADPEAPLEAAHSAFPLTVTAQHRYVLNAKGQPFFIQGDAAWSLIARLTREQIIEYLDDRAGRGFNALLINLIEFEFTDNPPNNIYGEPPFLTKDDFSTPNERYFAHAEFAILEAEKRGFAVLLAPAYLGYEGRVQGWYRIMKSQRPEQLRAYGRYLAQRFANRKNIIWVHGGDFDPPDMEPTQAVADGLLEGGSRLPATFHGGRDSVVTAQRTPRPAWLTLDNIYTSGNNVVTSALAQYQRSSTPFIHIEGAYDALGVDSNGVRREVYQAIFSGACGDVIGHDGLWRFTPDWRLALDSGAAHTLRHLSTLLSAARWPDLLPDRPGAFVVAGEGVGAEAAASSRSADHHLGIVYVPEHRAVTVDLDGLVGGSLHARAFDPATGSFMDLPDSPWVRAGRRNIAPPAGLEGPDWVVVLESGA